MPEPPVTPDPVSVRIRAWASRTAAEDPPFTDEQLAALHTLFLPAVLRALGTKKRAA